jgi:hypothetical protein
VDLQHKNKACHADGCSTRGRFGSLADDLPLWCGKHKKTGDVALQKLRCMHEGCKGPRSCGSLEDGVGLFCKKHKRPGDESRRKLRNIMRTARALRLGQHQ